MPKLVNLGAGRQAYEHPGYISVDKIESDGIDICWDCENGLPRDIPKDRWLASVVDKNGECVDRKIFEDNTVDEFLCHHFLEHVHNLIPLFDEMWDALKPDGILRISVPNGYHIKAAWSDPTHVRCFTPETFDYFCHDALAAFPYTTKEWRILKREIHGDPPDDLWEIYVEMQPVKNIGALIE